MNDRNLPFSSSEERRRPHSVRAEPITPELALIDSDLARRAREYLRDYGAEPPANPRPAFDAPNRRRRAFAAAIVLIPSALVAPLLVADGRLTASSSAARHVAGPRAGRPEPPAGGVSPARTVTDGVRRGTTLSEPGGRPRARPRGPAAPAAPARTPFPGRRVFAWVPVRGAAYYVVTFYRRGRKVYEGRSTRPRLSLPARWIFGGRRDRLRPGRYRWYVRAGYGRASARRYGKRIVDAKLVVPPASRR
jgi:hypothetical protein